MITKEVLFELPEILLKPKVIDNFFTDDMFSRVKEHVGQTGLGGDSLKYHTMYARWEASQIVFDDDIEQYCTERAREIIGDDSLEKTYFFATRYQRKDGCIPHLWEHVDQNGTQLTIDIGIENTSEWGIIVEDEYFLQTPNRAIAFCGQQHTHSRPPYPTRDESKYTTVLFLHFAQSGHWMHNEKNGLAKYGKDGNIRFFNRNRFLPMPDGPVNQPVCSCHDYSNMLGLYDEIAGYAFDSEPEIVDQEILSEEEIGPGIMKYQISKSSSRVIKGLIQNSMFKQWGESQVLYEKDKISVNTDIRNCFSYDLVGKELSCHPQDPIRRASESISSISNLVIERYRSKYKIVELESKSTLLLRYEEDGKFKNHIDDHPRFPRIVSMSWILNEDYDGGELEFKEFNLRIKPEAGSIIVFSSAYPYSHEVHPVLSGIRYSVVKWYQFKK